MEPSPQIDGLDVAVFTIPTDRPEGDGTLNWNKTTLVVVEVSAGGFTGLGYTYASRAAAQLIHDTLAREVQGRDPMNIPEAWRAMARSVRNIGRPGIASTAISAVDTALWDLKAKILDIPLVSLFGAARHSIPVYGSGGFTTYPIDELQSQLAGWAEKGIARVKMKVGADPAEDPERVRAAKEAIGLDCELFVDANGAYTRKQALDLADTFALFGVRWFEEPVSSDDLEGLRMMRDRAPAGMDIAAGEYGYDLNYFRRMLEAQAVDVLQADATRCGGFTGFLGAAALCEARSLPISAHTAPSLHCQICCSVQNAVHVEYFHDHVRIERMLFDGVPEPEKGRIAPDLSRPGIGLQFKWADAKRFAA